MRVESIIAPDAFTIYNAPMPSGRGALDPITVFLRDFGGSGQIVVECYGSAWSHWFGAIGSETLREFIATSNPEYIAEKLLSNTSQPFNKTTRLWVNRIAYAIVQALKDTP
jgi:hypothetical protein